MGINSFQRWVIQNLFSVCFRNQVSFVSLYLSTITKTSQLPLKTPFLFLPLFNDPNWSCLVICFIYSDRGVCLLVLIGNLTWPWLTWEKYTSIKEVACGDACDELSSLRLVGDGTADYELYQPWTGGSGQSSCMISASTSFMTSCPEFPQWCSVPWEA